ncbi:MAG: radical SAM protein [Pseudomonadota bacterium]
MSDMSAGSGGRERSGFLPDRTVHLHPLARCNLACRHCYSSSSPQASAVLSMEVLAPALETLRGEGYEVLSLSGGEPMLYPELGALTSHARALGFRVVAITNGFRVGLRFADLLCGFDGLAVSFDGLKPVHDDVRGNPRAFDVGLAALDYLKTIGKPAAAAYTVSQASLPDIPEFIELVADKGVRAVQLRPLVMAGRARSDYVGPALRPADMSRLWLIAEALSAGYDGRPAIHADLAHASAISADRSAWDPAFRGGERLLSDLVNPLVITPTGALRPYTYDFPRRYDLGHVGALAARRVSAVRQAFPKVADLLRRALDDVARRDEFVDWFAYCRDFGARAHA